jgi:uncharacterized membrane protein YccC
MARLCDPDAPLSPALEAEAARAGRRRMHADLPLALLSGAAAAIAILLSCAAWIVAGWGDGAAAPVMAAVFCCFFAAMDDPVPAIKSFGVFSLVSLPLSALYMFAILPAIDGFPLLVLVMAPPLIFLGLYIPNPATMGAALAVLMGFCNALALQETFSADFASFLNANLGQFVGLLAAIMVTAGLRSMGADASARRLLGRTWRGLANLARARTAPEPAAFAALLVDRLGMLTPSWPWSVTPRPGRRRRPARPAGGHEPRRRPGRAAGPGRRRPGGIDDALDGVGEHFAALASGRTGAPGEALLNRLDDALGRLLDTAGGSAVRGVSGLVGLRRNLFPDAPAFIQEPVR